MLPAKLKAKKGHNSVKQLQMMSKFKDNVYFFLSFTLLLTLNEIDASLQKLLI